MWLTSWFVTLIIIIIIIHCHAKVNSVIYVKWNPISLLYDIVMHHASFKSLKENLMAGQTSNLLSAVNHIKQENTSNQGYIAYYNSWRN